MDKKAKLGIVIVIILLLLAGVGYIFLSKDDTSDSQQEEESSSQANEEDSDRQESDLNPPKQGMTFSYYNSAEALRAVEKAGLEWQSDAVLNKCNGLTISSLETPTKTYEFVAGNDGTYRSWFCEYYSSSMKQIMIITYNGEVDKEEPIDIGEYSESLYNHGTNPEKVSDLADATEVYSKVDTNDDEYYYNMRVKYLDDYGFVWTVEEMSKTELDEYDMNKTVNTYIFNAVTGEFIESVDSEVY